MMANKKNKKNHRNNNIINTSTKEEKKAVSTKLAAWSVYFTYIALVDYKFPWPTVENKVMKLMLEVGTLQQQTVI